MTQGSHRREALLMGAGMVAVALAAHWGRPTPRVDAARAARALETLVPTQFGPWALDTARAALIRPATEVARLYPIYDQVLERVYTGPNGAQVMLSMAYGAEQSAGLQVHRPEVCYPAAGFRVQGEPQALVLQLAGQRVPATRLMAELPGRPEPITYWLVLGDQVQSGASSFRWRQLALGLQGVIADGTLVRVSSVDPDPTHAWALQARFADDLARALAPADRARVIGQAGR